MATKLRPATAATISPVSDAQRADMPEPEAAPGVLAGPPAGRLASIDALRGFDMFWIVGGREVVIALVALGTAVLPAAWIESMATFFPGADWFRYQFQHVPWEGFSAWDLIMPLFLFIVGAAMPFSFAKRIEEGQSMSAIYAKVFRRVAILWILGMVAQGHLLDYEIAKLHFFSNTLQAIAVGYLVAAVALLHLPIVLQAVLTASLLIGFYLLMLLAPFPGHAAGALEENANLARYVDETVLRGFRDGTTYTWILSSMGFAGTVLLGVFSGHILRSPWSAWTRFAALALSGGLLLALGWFWAGGFDRMFGIEILGSWRFPIIKHLFTSSMVLWAAGWSFLLLALFYLLIDMLGVRRWATFFIVIGANAIFAYMAVRLIPFGEIASKLVGGLTRQLAGLPSPWPVVGGAILTMTTFAVLWLVLWYMYRKGTFLRV